MRESLDAKKARARKIIALLERAYDGDAAVRLRLVR
jgi:hypothetical protein